MVNLYGESSPSRRAAPAKIWRRAPSKVYPLSERLFGNMNLGPPSGE
jgi:hypothetical protein